MGDQNMNGYRPQDDGLTPQVWGYGEVSQTRETPLFMGPLRIPAENFQPRIRKEAFSQDVVNSRLIESWNAAVPRQQQEYYRTDIPGGVMVAADNSPRTAEEARVAAAFPRGNVGLGEIRAALRKFSNDANLAITALAAAVESEGRTDAAPRDSKVPRTLKTAYEDMQPLSSRNDARDFRQSKPYDPLGPGLALNPYFDRYDPTRDPRNAVREVRSVVYELKEADRGLEESARLRERSFTNTYVKEGEAPTKLTQTYELMRPKIDNPEVVYRGQKDSLWKYGSPI